jgi:hypothetical protein
MSYVNINDFDSNGFYLLGKAGYGGDSSDVSNQLQTGVTDIFSTMGAFAALKSDGSVVTWGGIEGIVSQNPWYIDLSYNIAYIDGKYIGIGKYNPPAYSPTNTTILDISANVSIQGKLVADDISSSYIRSISTQWTNRPAGVITYTGGYIGIGKTNPTSQLDITGNSRISGSLAVDDTTLYVNGTDNVVGIGTSSPQTTLDVSGQIKCSGNFSVDTNTLFVDTDLRRVGIGDSTPQYVLDVSGSAQFRNLNNAYTSTRVASVSRITQSQLGLHEVVQLANTGTAIQFMPGSISVPSIHTNTVNLYTFDTHVFFNTIKFTIDVNPGTFANGSNDISNSLYIVDKNGVILHQTIWTKTSVPSSPIFIPSTTLDLLTYDRFPIHLRYQYRVVYQNTSPDAYLINQMDVDTTYTTNALFVQGNTAIVNGTLTVGKTTSTLVNPPTVDISGTLALSQNLLINNTDLYVNTTTRNVGIGCNPGSSTILDISTNKTGPAMRILNQGLTSSQTLALGIGKTGTTTNQYRILYEHIGDNSSSNRLLIGTVDISNILSIGANRNIGIGLQDRVPFSRLSLGNLSNARSIALHEDIMGDRFFGMGAVYSSTGDVSNALHLHARNSGSTGTNYGQLILTSDGNIGIGTRTHAIQRRLVIGNTSATNGPYLEFNNHVITTGLDPTIYKNYAIGTSLANDIGTPQQLQFVYTGTPASSTNNVLMAINSQGYMGLGINPTTNLLDVSGVAPIRLSTTTGLTVRNHTSNTGVFVVDTTNGHIGINNNTPSRTLDVNGTAHVSGLVNISGDLIIDDTTFRVNTTTKRIGIGKSSPQTAIDMNGSITATLMDSCSNIFSPTYTNGLTIQNTSPYGGSVIRLNNDISSQGMFIGFGGSINSRSIYNGAVLNSAGTLHSTGGWNIGTAGQSAIRLYTNSTERLRIDSCGNVGIGVDSQSVISKGKMVIEGFQYYPSGSQIRSTSYNLGGSTASVDLASGSVPLSLYCSNNIACNTLVVFSDERIKKDVEPITDLSGLDAIEQLRPVHFNYIDVTRRNAEHKHAGFIAQEVRRVIPSAVSYIQDTIPDMYGFVEIDGNTMKLIQTDSDFTRIHSFIESGITPGTSILLYGTADEKHEERIEIRVIRIDSDDTLIYTPLQSTVTGYPENGIYFAYGRMVTDYHVVDNGVILAHCVSAVKTLVQTQRKQEDELSAMRNEIAELRQMILAMKN